jgi:hypothetical protein
MHKIIFVVVLTLIIGGSCTTSTSPTTDPFAFTSADSIKAAEYHINNYFDSKMADTLLVNAVTFIGRKPVVATSQTRFNREFRSHYINMASGFNFFLYHIGPDSLHSYFIIRPARSLEGNLRGVLGQYRLSADTSMHSFVEILNTRIKSREALQKIGLILFEELLEKGHVEAFINDTTMVEWPDGRLMYDDRLNEWRYALE